MAKHSNQVDIYIGDNDVAIKREGESSVSTARILGRETEDSATWIYLDRILHRLGESSFGEWSVTGAVSSVLFKQA